MSELTIVIPTIGRPRLSDAIESLHRQSSQDFEFIVGTDTGREGAGSTRNRLLRAVTTPWAGFLDDDDVLLPEYVRTFYAERDRADVLVFKMDHPTMGIIPRTSVIEWSNVGISFAAKTALLREVPFYDEDELEGECANEDFAMLKALEDRGAAIAFSDYVGYEVRGGWR